MFRLWDLCTNLPTPSQFPVSDLIDALLSAWSHSYFETRSNCLVHSQNYNIHFFIIIIVRLYGIQGNVTQKC